MALPKINDNAWSRAFLRGVDLNRMSVEVHGRCQMEASTSDRDIPNAPMGEMPETSLIGQILDASKQQVRGFLAWDTGPKGWFLHMSSPPIP